MDPALVQSLEGGWVEGIILDPEAFRELAQGPEHEGWKGLYRWDLTTAALHLSGVGLQRSRAQQALIDSDIERLARRSFALTYDAWVQSDLTGNGADDPVPQEAAGAIPILGLIAALDRGDNSAAAEWNGRIPKYRNKKLEALSGNVTPTGIRAKGNGPESAIADCLRAHQAARERKDPQALGPCGGSGATPLIAGHIAPEFHDALYNPLFYKTQLVLSEAQRKEVGRPVTEDVAAPALEHLIYSGHWRIEDLEAYQSAQPSPTLALFGLPDLDVSSDNVDLAREWVSHLDTQLDQWWETTLQSADDAGHQIANDLQPLAVYRSGVLQHQARRAIRAEQPHMASALLDLAIDASAPNQIGGRNHPSLFILRAESRLMTGRTRLALYDIQVLLGSIQSIR